MDLDEWEILPRDGFIDYNHEVEEVGERKIFSISSPGSVFKMNHFTCHPSPPSPRTGSPRLLPNQQLFPVEILLEHKIGKDPEAELIEEVVKVHTETDTCLVSSATNDKVKDSDLDEVAQVFFTKLKENDKFVDMKTYSPKGSPSEVPTQIDAGVFNFKDRNETTEMVTSPRKKVENDMGMMNKKSEIDGDNREEATRENTSSGGLKIWKWSLNGIGAICSFGVATAATFCVIILGSHQRNKQLNQNQKISIPDLH